MSWYITNLISAFLLPPLNILIVAIAGLLLWRKRPRIAHTLLIIAVALLWLFSTPYFAEAMLHELEGKPDAVDTKKTLADAIVVLGGGTYFNAPEYGEDTVSDASLLRLRYAAKLHRATGKPILVSGGKPLGNMLSEAQQMKQTLEKEFNIPVQWTEDDSNNTLESAYLSRKTLQQSNITRIYLVTHAWHMPRSVQIFRAAGFEVIPAPTAFNTRYQTDLLAFIPNAHAMLDSKIVMHELIGMLWYRIKS